ncbi:alpha/beta fold hydrolase [Bradyrhizobium sp.]|uniref:alpha/beta hydrolase family protein n=1 Tax=Bradyrhizobium sp. TaxID=376 RepID=UPI0025BE8D06|nr:alpha/beta fold hydrolase [Bradyrhizobium sp.]
MASVTTFAQSLPDTGMFDPVSVINGIQTTPSACEEMVRRQTAVWVRVDGRGYCLRYYAAGVALDRPNPVVAGWMSGDVMGGPKGVAHQQGLGVASMIEQSATLSNRYAVPYIFLARPGTYGSSGKHYDVRHTPLEARLVDAQIDALKRRYRIDQWVLGGHSGGGTLAAEFLAWRDDIRCAVLSSPAAAYRARLEKKGFVQRLKTEVFFDPYDSIDRIPNQPGRRIFLVADPRDTNIPFSTQELYFDGLKRRGLDAWLVPLQKAPGPKYHSLVDFGETAIGMCASGATTDSILQKLRDMPQQSERISN